MVVPMCNASARFPEKLVFMKSCMRKCYVCVILPLYLKATGKHSDGYMTGIFLYMLPAISLLFIMSDDDILVMVNM